MEKPSWGIVIWAGIDASRTGKYVGINIETKERILEGYVENSGIEITEFVACVHAYSLTKKNDLPLIPYLTNDTALKWVYDKGNGVRYNASPARTKEIVERAKRFLLFGAKNYYPCKWRSDIWGMPEEVLKK